MGGDIYGCNYANIPGINAFKTICLAYHITKACWYFWFWAIWFYSGVEHFRCNLTFIRIIHYTAQLNWLYTLMLAKSINQTLPFWGRGWICGWGWSEETAVSQCLSGDSHLAYMVTRACCALPGKLLYFRALHKHQSCLAIATPTSLKEFGLHVRTKKHLSQQRFTIISLVSSILTILWYVYIRIMYECIGLWLCGNLIHQHDFYFFYYTKCYILVMKCELLNAFSQCDFWFI